jgi:hypothetical protein
MWIWSCAHTLVSVLLRPYLLYPVNNQARLIVIPAVVEYYTCQVQY